MRVSVAMATYNGAKYLQYQLESIATQTLTPCELCICDDGSTDATLDVVKDFSANAPFPVCLESNPSRLGWRRNFMKSASRCSGDLIAFCDQDDVWSPDKLATQAACFSDRRDILLSYHNAEIIDENGALVGRRLNPLNRDRFFDFESAGPFAYAPGFTECFSRKLLTLSSAFDRSIDLNALTELMPHDKWFFWLATVFGSVAYLAKPLALYRRHGQNTTGLVTSKRERFEAKFNDRRVQYRQLGSIWSNRRDLCRAFSVILDGNGGEQQFPDHRTKINTALRAYDRLIGRTKRRSGLYDSNSRAQKLMMILNNCLYGDYWPGDPWTYRFGGLLRDISTVLAPMRIN